MNEKENESLKFKLKFYSDVWITRTAIKEAISFILCLWAKQIVISI